MPKRQGRDDFGLNLQTRKADGVEIQENFHVVIFIETTVNGALFDDFAIRCDEKFPRHSYLELRLASTELGLRYGAIVVRVEVSNLRCVLNR